MEQPVWKDLWENISDEYLENLLKEEERSLVWQDIKKTVGNFRGLKTLEIGSGVGIYSILFAREGARVTLLDSSYSAISRAKKFFKKNKLKATFIVADALNRNYELENKFDITMSFGLCEHFSGVGRVDIINAHYRYLKTKGITFIAVPNKFCPQYRVWKFLSEKTGRWKFGYEEPFSKYEMKYIMHLCNFKHREIIDYRFFETFNQINPFRLITNVQKIHQHNKGIFDKFSQDFIVVAEK